MRFGGVPDFNEFGSGEDDGLHSMASEDRSILSKPFSKERGHRRGSLGMMSKMKLTADEVHMKSVTE